VLIIPAIDLFNGACVRLEKGDYAKVVTYSEDPIAVAREFQAAGARLIHIVDLNRARGDNAGNRDVIREIRENVDVALEVGGGVRTQKDVAELLAAGVMRIIIGTALVKNPDDVERWIREETFFPIAGIHARDRTGKIQGWIDDGAVRGTDIAAGPAAMGFQELIYTNIARDGTLAGPDIESTNQVARASRLPVILSGGIGSAEDVAAIAAGRERGVRGLIVGKALYEKKVRLAEIIDRYQTADDST